ncbi:MAG TPA: galactoside O-acetyltransferase [Methanosphaera sp.]|nr:galactoside O-acetyltransferase [Methanosphaera sp.]
MIFMDCEEFRVDMRKLSMEDMEKYSKMNELVFKLNHTLPGSEEYAKLLKELFGDNIGKNSTITAPFSGAAFDQIVMGDNVFINSNSLLMARGGITFEDDVMLAANVQVISNNHDVYDRQVLTCKPVLIKEGAWIGAGATILPGVCVGKYAVVGACAVVTKDVPDYAVVVGNPAKVVKELDKNKFE